MNDNILQEVTVSALTNAIEANLFSFYETFSHWPRVEVYDGDA